MVLEPPNVLPEGVEVRVEVVPSEIEGPLLDSGETLGQKLMKYAGRAVGLPEDAAVSHDHYLYGAHQTVNCPACPAGGSAAVRPPSPRWSTARTRRAAGARKDRRINICRIVAFRSAKERGFRGAKGDTCFRAGPKVSFATAQLLPLVGRDLRVLPGRFRRWASFNARSIFSTVRTVGECLPDSSRERVSSRTPASRASSA